MKYCVRCGKELQDDARFCGGCGSEFEIISGSENKANSGSPLLSFDGPPTPLPKPESGLKIKIVMGRYH
ncbi:MAG: zinc ribbon domain-containing protein [Syntrophomonas sp.]